MTDGKYMHFGRIAGCKRRTYKIASKEIICLGEHWINLAGDGSVTGSFECGNRLLEFVKHGKLHDWFLLVTLSSLLHAP